MTALAPRLSDEERALLDQCEEVIAAGLLTFMDVGNALAMVHVGKLYREAFGTFDEYCAKKWGITDRRARQLMDAAAVGTMVPVQNERQARELLAFPEDERAEIWAAVVEVTDGRPTAAAIRALRSSAVVPALTQSTEEVTTETAGHDGFPAQTAADVVSQSADGSEQDRGRPSPGADPAADGGGSNPPSAVIPTDAPADAVRTDETDVDAVSQPSPSGEPLDPWGEVALEAIATMRQVVTSARGASLFATSQEAFDALAELHADVEEAFLAAAEQRGST
jgi:hypothetical protein